MVLKGDLARSQRPLQEEAQRQLRKLRLNERADGVVGKREDLLALLLPLVVLQEERRRLETPAWNQSEASALTAQEFSLYLKASW